MDVPAQRAPNTKAAHCVVRSVQKSSAHPPARSRSLLAPCQMAVDKPIAVVVHATSKQGTSAVISLLQTNKFVVKAITRDASSTSVLFYRPPLPRNDHLPVIVDTCSLPQRVHDRGDT